MSTAPIPARRLRVGAIAEDFLARNLMWRSRGWPFKAKFHEGKDGVLLVTGTSASGKSLLAESLLEWGKGHHATTAIRLSMRERTAAGSFDIAAAMRKAKYHQEGSACTGWVSAQAVHRTFEALRSPKRDKARYPLVMLDEPEVGLSEGFARALGELIGQESKGLSRRIAGVIVVTHSRALVRGLCEGLRAEPCCITMGHAMPLQPWLDHQEIKTVEDLLALGETDRKQHGKVSSVLAKL